MRQVPSDLVSLGLSVTSCRSPRSSTAVLSAILGRVTRRHINFCRRRGFIDMLGGGVRSDWVDRMTHSRARSHAHTHTLLRPDEISGLATRTHADAPVTFGNATAYNVLGGVLPTEERDTYPTSIR